jgi:hypothetical protein
MIPYEELVAALDRFVARNGGTPQSARAPAGSAMPAFAPPPAAAASSFDEHAAHDVDLPSFDEHHDPDLAGHAGHGGDEDATHVGASPGSAALPPPLAPVSDHADDHSNEIDIGDVLTDDEM